MEVHHHAHTARKKWTHYFWEFLMLFLAVFCGFLAEYQLEHKIEKEKGLQYIQSFVEDLKHDTASLGSMIMGYRRKIEKLNLISSCYDSLFAKLPCNSCLTDLFNNAQAFEQLYISDRTIQQLKNAGGMRLLSKTDADSITGYDKLIMGYRIDETTVLQETQTSLRAIMNKLFSYSMIRNFSDNGYTVKEDPLLTNDKLILTEFFNLLARYHNYCKRLIKEQIEIKSNAASLIIYFTKKYHLK